MAIRKKTQLKMAVGSYVLFNLILASIFSCLNCYDTNKLGVFKLRKKGYRLKNKILRVVTAEDVLTCAHNCLLETHPECESFNFIEDNMVAENCEMNSKATLTENDVRLVPQRKSLFFEKMNTRYPSTCSMLKFNNSESPNGFYMIQPNDDEAPFEVFCDMTDKNKIGVAVFSHDSEESTHVSGYEGQGEYKKIITYSNVTMEQIVSVVNASLYCEQFIKWYCKGAGFYFNYHVGADSWWVSRQGYKMLYWGGAIPGSKKCACGMTNSCFNPAKPCNCESVDNQWIEDSGFLVNKEYLPVSELRFGDTGHLSEEGYHTLGKLLCWG